MIIPNSTFPVLWHRVYQDRFFSFIAWVMTPSNPNTFNSLNLLIYFLVFAARHAGYDLRVIYED